MTEHEHEYEHRVIVATRMLATAMLVAGVVASAAVNVLAADELLHRASPTPTATAVWAARGMALSAPLAFMATVELLPRIPAEAGRELVLAARAITGLVAFGAGWISYWHIVDLAHGYGWTGPSPYLLPLGLDGMVGVCSLALLALSRAETVATTAAPTVVATSPAGAVPAAPQAAPPALPHPEPAEPVSDAPSGPRRGPATSRAPEILAVIAANPDWSNSQVAAHLGCTERTVRTHRPKLVPNVTTGELVG